MRELFIALLIVMILASIYVVYRFAIAFMATPGTSWARLLAAGKGSATIVLHMGVILGTGLSSLWAMAGDILQDGDVQSFLKAQIPAKYVLVGGALLATLTIVARLRSIR